MNDENRKCEAFDCDLPGRYTDPSLEGRWYCKHHRERAMNFNQEQKIKKLEEDRDSWRRTSEILERENISSRKQVADLETLLGKATMFGFEVVNAAEAAGMVLRVKNKKTRIIEAIRQLREFLCRR